MGKRRMVNYNKIMELDDLNRKLGIRMIDALRRAKERGIIGSVNEIKEDIFDIETIINRLSVSEDIN